MCGAIWLSICRQVRAHLWHWGPVVRRLHLHTSYRRSNQLSYLLLFWDRLRDVMNSTKSRQNISEVFWPRWCSTFQEIMQIFHNLISSTSWHTNVTSHIERLVVPRSWFVCNNTWVIHRVFWYHVLNTCDLVTKESGQIFKYCWYCICYNKQKNL